MYYQTKNLFHRVTQEDLDSITVLNSKTMHFQKPTILFYEGQIPIVGYIIIDGEVTLLKNKKVKNILKKGFIFGIRELYHNGVVLLEAKVSPMTQLLYIDKSLLLEILSHKHGEQLKRLFQNFISEHEYDMNT